MREDALLIPIASIAGNTVRPLSFLRADNGNTALTREARALTGTTWRLWLPAAGTPIDVNVLRPAMADSHCAAQQVWRTSHVARVPEPHTFPIKKVGLAVRGAAVERADDVSTLPDDGSRRVGRLITQLTHAKETERLTRQPQDPFAKYDAAKRASTPVRIGALRRHTVDNTSTYYFEASKTYLPHETELIIGWVVESPLGLNSYHVRMFDDVEKEGENAVVWGVVRSGGRSYWVFEWQGYESESYAVHEWPSGATRLKIDGGGC